MIISNLYLFIVFITRIGCVRNGVITDAKIPTFVPRQLQARIIESNFDQRQLIEAETK